MILRGKAAYTPARLPVLRWLTAGGANVPPYIRDLLLSEIFTSQSAVIMGILNGLIFNAVAQYLTGGFVFVRHYVANTTAVDTRPIFDNVHVMFLSGAAPWRSIFSFRRRRGR